MPAHIFGIFSPRPYWPCRWQSAGRPHLSITTGGTISQSGTLTATSAGSSFTTTAADKTIDLDIAGNAITGATAFATAGTAGHVTWNNGTAAVILAPSANGHEAFGIAANILTSVRLRQGTHSYSWPNRYANCWLPDPMDLEVRPLQ